MLERREGEGDADLAARLAAARAGGGRALAERDRPAERAAERLLDRRRGRLVAAPQLQGPVAVAQRDPRVARLVAEVVEPEKEKDVSVLVFPPPYLGRVPGDAADF